MVFGAAEGNDLPVKNVDEWSLVGSLGQLSCLMPHNSLVREIYLLVMAAAALCDQLCHRRGAHESDRLDTFVIAQALNNFARALDHLEHPWGHPGVGHETCHTAHRQRGLMSMVKQ